MLGLCVLLGRLPSELDGESLADLRDLLAFTRNAKWQDEMQFLMVSPPVPKRHRHLVTARRDRAGELQARLWAAARGKRSPKPKKGKGKP